MLEQAFEARGGSSGGTAGDRGAAGAGSGGKERKLSAMESVRLEHEAAKRKRVEEPSPPSSSSDPLEPWLAAGLVVKVMHQELADGKFYRKKGRVEKVHNQYTGDIRMLEGGALIRLEQEMLETVIPNVGKQVRLVKGTHKGRLATMRGIDVGRFCVHVTLDDGTDMDGLGYDEVCKVADAA